MAETIPHRRLLMIAEDEADLREYLDIVVTGLGYDTQCFENGAALIAALQSEGQRFPEAILTDITMPLMSGLELMRNLRTNGHSVPVVLLTAHSDFHNLQQGVRLGAVDFLTKPCDQRELSLVVQRALELGYRQKRALHIIDELAKRCPDAKDDLERLRSLHRHEAIFQAMNSVSRIA